MNVVEKEGMTALLDQLQRAIALHLKGDLKSARVLYEEVLRFHPNQFDALHLLGVIAGQEKDPHRALELIGEAIKVNPHDAMAYCNRASALMKLMMRH